jgi:uncharacterized protein (DUF305 family)
MKRSLRSAARAALPAIAASLVITACGAARSSTLGTPGPASINPSGRSPAAVAAADSGRPPYTRDDVDFISGMIGHHAQAVLMAGWAPSHGASSSLQSLAERIVVAQRDEIAFMQRWLRERREQVPDAGTEHMMMAGMDMKLMPGMLTREQLMELDKARGPDFDRLFLQFMIQHHEGALTMVDKLFAAHGAGQDEDVFKFAVDVHADQTTEINRMSLMLKSVPSSR